MLWMMGERWCGERGRGDSLFLVYVRRLQGILCFNSDGWYRTAGQSEVCLHQQHTVLLKKKPPTDAV